MDSVQLMNRTDTKFILQSKLLPELLKKASEHYKILEIDNQRNFAYQSTYLDTDHYLFFSQHMKSKPGRFKVRYRIYECTGVSYLEVKCKTNKNRTIKWRIKNELINNQPNDKALQFLSGHINDVAFDITPVLMNRFFRITLAGLETKERITLDYNLSFSDNDNSLVTLPYIAIAELKREGYTGKSPFLYILKEMRIRQSSFSKYCMGTALLRPMPKTNILKPTILAIQKLGNENFIRNA
jgi:hypothetical protein